MHRPPRRKLRRDHISKYKHVVKSPINLRLPDEILTKLKVHSLATGVPASDIVAKLIDDNLTEYDLVPTHKSGRRSRSSESS